jgi:hypothetical protein
MLVRTISGGLWMWGGGASAEVNWSRLMMPYQLWVYTYLDT